MSRGRFLANTSGPTATASIRARVPVVVGRAGMARAEVVTFSGLKDSREHLACIWQPLKPVPLVRVHSECLTGDVLGSLRCDCGPQLEESLELLSMEGGVLLYMRQEGRGIGLYNKLDTYLLQDEGADTYLANQMIGRAPDERDYSAAAQMLNALSISKVDLLTNNPEKARQLQRDGIALRSVLPTKVHINQHNREYLLAKARVMRHSLGDVADGSESD